MKNALVTGGSSGIGKGIALALARDGYNIVFAHYGDDDNARLVQEEIERKWERPCYVLEGDLSSEEFPEQLVSFAIDRLGTIDVLVNNAGRTVFESVLDLRTSTINTLFDLNYRAPLLLTKAVAKHMIEHQIRGSIVNTASVRGLRAYADDGVYGGLKAALIRTTESFALDLAAYGIRVNSVAPGAIQVRYHENANAHYQELGPRIPLQRAGTPEDIANLVVWLVSDKASYVTGITIPVDGGLILPGMPERVPDGYSNYGWASFSK